jgi:hypothetical protein
MSKSAMANPARRLFGDGCPASSWRTGFSRPAPEAMDIQELGAGCSGVNQIEGQVVAAAYRGSLVEYEISAGERTINAHVVNPKGKPLFEHKQRVCVRFAPEDVTLIHGD